MISNVNELYRHIRARLQTALAQERTDHVAALARRILADYLNISAEELVGGSRREVSINDIQSIEPVLEALEEGKPYTKVTGRAFFYGLEFAISEQTLDPRADTETLIEAVLSYSQTPQGKNTRVIADLGTGSGCILAALLANWQGVTGIGIDVSSAACLIARENLHRHRLQDRGIVAQGSWTDPLDLENIDIIVCNPPYIDRKESLPENVVKYDPELALFAEENGLAAYRAIFERLKSTGEKSPDLFFEIGRGQEKDIERIGRNAGFFVVRTYPDLNRITRVIEFTKKQM